MGPTVISLFSGAGGLDYGFEAAGFGTRVCIEFDADACDTLRASRAWNVLQADALETGTDSILAAADLDRGEADTLISGPPCQPFSTSGYWASGDSRRLRDPRAETLGAVMSLWEESLPRTVLLENVPGLAHHRRSDALPLIFARIKQINERHGTRYRPQWAILNSADFGVPQTRRRFLLVASRSGERFKFPEPTHQSRQAESAAGCRNEFETHRTAWDAIGDLDVDLSEELALTGRWAGLLPSIPEGQNYLFHTDRGEGLPLFGWRRRYWSFLLKLAKHLPSWTIQAEPGPATGPFHWKNRRLSILELSRLQTFPANVALHGGDRSIRRQLGNAVPSLLAEVMAREMRTQLLHLEPISEPPRLGPGVRRGYPGPEPVAEVPEEYRSLIGSDSAHPGTGLGRGALARHNGTS